MNKRKKGVNYKLNLTYPKVKFEGFSVSVEPLKSVELKISYWLENLEKEDIPFIKKDFKNARTMVYNNIDTNVFSNKFIYLLEHPTHIVNNSSYICWKFHLFTKPETQIKDITYQLQHISKELYENILKDIEMK